MFTGIVEEIGILKQIERRNGYFVVTIQGNLIFDDIKIGDSVSVSGVCLTVTTLKDKTFKADTSYETLSRTTFSELKVGDRVNLERAICAGGRFGGHIVTGHIDSVCVISSILKQEKGTLIKIKATSNITNMIVEKGSITIDGISLTVNNVTKDSFCVVIIEHTLKNTTLLEKKVGEKVNIEIDIIGKYVAKLCSNNTNFQKQNKENITKEILLQNGF